jgi:flavin prenyltransferase
MSLTSVSPPLVLAITGASGAVYAVRLLQCLCDANVDVHLVISPSGAAVVHQELLIDLRSESNQANALLRYHWSDSSIPHAWTPRAESQVQANAGRVVLHDYRNYMTPIASGSFLTRGMVICPCSGATLSGVVHASGNNLIQRAADVHLKEHRKLVLVPRETPMSVFQLENMKRAADAGAIVLPAMPGWYHGVRSVVARILDHLQVPHQLMKRWGEEGSIDHETLTGPSSRSGDA